MKNILAIILISIVSFELAAQQDRSEITGELRDIESNDPLEFATISAYNSEKLHLVSSKS